MLPSIANREARPPAAVSSSAARSRREMRSQAVRKLAAAVTRQPRPEILLYPKDVLWTERALPRRDAARKILRQGAAYAAVITVVGEVDDQSDDQPDNQARPVDPAQLVHHIAIKEDAENRHQRNPRRAKRPGLLWIGAAQDH